MAHQRSRSDRPRLREALSAALVACAVGAIVAWTAAPVAAGPAPPRHAAQDPLGAVVTRGPQWIVSPRAARPGEVVHVRLKFTPTAGTTVPLVLFAFLNDLRHPVQGRVYPAEGTFGADL